MKFSKVLPIFLAAAVSAAGAQVFLKGTGERPPESAGKADSGAKFEMKRPFASLDMVKVRPEKGAKFQMFTIGNSSQSYTAMRWVEAFEINKYETTYEFWRSIKTVAEQLGYSFAHSGRPGSQGKTGGFPAEEDKLEPVTMVSWYDAAVWCNALSEIYGLEPCYKHVLKNGTREVIKDSAETAKLDLAVCDWKAGGYRLPTEAEWEFAATRVSGGNSGGDLVSGQIRSLEYSYGDELGEDSVSWSLSNSNKTQTVGTAGNAGGAAGSGTANFLGLFDMGGNVLEFCWDWFEPRYGEAEPGTRSAGAAYGSDRVCRGGSFSPLTIFCSAGDRYHYDPNEYHDFMGFRIARTLTE